MERLPFEPLHWRVLERSAERERLNPHLYLGTYRVGGRLTPEKVVERMSEKVEGESRFRRLIGEHPDLVEKYKHTPWESLDKTGREKALAEVYSRNPHAFLASVGIERVQSSPTGEIQSLKEMQNKFAKNSFRPLKGVPQEVNRAIESLGKNTKIDIALRQTAMDLIGTYVERKLSRNRPISKKMIERIQSVEKTLQGITEKVLSMAEKESAAESQAAEKSRSLVDDHGVVDLKAILANKNRPTATKDRLFTPTEKAQHIFDVVKAELANILVKGDKKGQTETLKSLLSVLNSPNSAKVESTGLAFLMKLYKKATVKAREKVKGKKLTDSEIIKEFIRLGKMRIKDFEKLFMSFCQINPPCPGATMCPARAVAAKR